jgi:hypothetical protein
VVAGGGQDEVRLALGLGELVDDCQELGIRCDTQAEPFVGGRGFVRFQLCESPISLCRAHCCGRRGVRTPDRWCVKARRTVRRVSSGSILPVQRHFCVRLVLSRPARICPFRDTVGTLAGHRVAAAQ